MEHELFERMLCEAGYPLDAARREVAWEIWEQMLKSFRVFLRKNKQYGNSFIEVGARGAYIETHAKYNRLRELVWKQDEMGILNSSGDIVQNAMDMSIYAQLMVYCIHHKNILGEDTE